MMTKIKIVVEKKDSETICLPFMLWKRGQDNWQARAKNSVPARQPHSQQTTSAAGSPGPAGSPPLWSRGEHCAWAGGGRRAKGTQLWPTVLRHAAALLLSNLQFPSVNNQDTAQTASAL